MSGRVGPTGYRHPGGAYRVDVVHRNGAEDPDSEERRRLDEQLAGLDPEDPEVQAFSEHLARIHRQHPVFTVEGNLSGVIDFAESANRAQGTRRSAAVLMVVLILLAVVFALWEAATFIVSTLVG